MVAEYRFQLKTVRYLPGGRRSVTVASYGDLEDALSWARSELAEARRYSRRVTISEGSAVVFEAVAEAQRDGPRRPGLLQPSGEGQALRQDRGGGLRGGRGRGPLSRRCTHIYKTIYTEYTMYITAGMRGPQDVKDMQAVIEYMNGEQETLIGVERLGQPIAERLLEEYDLKRMWLLEDDEDPDMAGCEEPFWSLETYWVEREDGETARVLVNDWHAGETIWEALERDYPEAVDLMDECPESDRVSQRRTWDETFRPGDGEDLAFWLAEAMTECRMSLSGSDAVVEARRSEGIATVTWTDGQKKRVQTIALNPGDFEKLAVGHDPVAEQWEDGCGNLVCIDNAKEVA